MTEKSQIPKTFKESRKAVSDKIFFTLSTPSKEPVFMKSPHISLPSRQTLTPKHSFTPKHIDQIPKDQDVRKYPSTDYIPRHEVKINESTEIPQSVNYQNSLQNSDFLTSALEIQENKVEKPTNIITRNDLKFQEKYSSHKKRSFSEEVIFKFLIKGN